MATEVGTSKDYAKWVQERAAERAGLRNWEEFFTKPHEQAAEQVAAATQYDISKAFASYKQSQRNLLQQSRLGTGFKERIAADLESQYLSTYQQARQQEASQLSQLQQTYAKQQTEAEESMMALGQQYADIEKAVYQYAQEEAKNLGIEWGDYDFLDALNLNVEQGGLGWRETDASGVTRLTKRGQAAFNKIFNYMGKGGKSFGSYLYKTDPELYKTYVQNKAQIQSAVGGVEAGMDIKTMEKEIAQEDYVRSYITKAQTYRNQQSTEVADFPITVVSDKKLTDAEKTRILLTFDPKSIYEKQDSGFWGAFEFEPAQPDVTKRSDVWNFIQSLPESTDKTALIEKYEKYFK